MPASAAVHARVWLTLEAFSSPQRENMRRLLWKKELKRREKEIKQDANNGFHLVDWAVQWRRGSAKVPVAPPLGGFFDI